MISFCAAARWVRFSTGRSVFVRVESWGVDFRGKVGEFLFSILKGLGFYAENAEEVRLLHPDCYKIVEKRRQFRSWYKLGVLIPFLTRNIYFLNPRELSHLPCAPPRSSVFSPAFWDPPLKKLPISPIDSLSCHRRNPQGPRPRGTTWGAAI